MIRARAPRVKEGAAPGAKAARTPSAAQCVRLEKAQPLAHSRVGVDGVNGHAHRPSQAYGLEEQRVQPALGAKVDAREVELDRSAVEQGRTDSRPRHLAR